MEINIRNLHNGFFIFWDKNIIKNGCELTLKVFLLDVDKEFFLVEQHFLESNNPFFSLIDIPSGDYKIVYTLSDEKREKSSSINRKIKCLTSNYNELLSEIELIHDELSEISDRIGDIYEEINDKF